jgi:hypothetical protein
MYMPIPSGSQAAAAANQQQYQQQQQQQNKPPYNQFANSSNYDEPQSKDYSSYNPQAQIKSSGSNII